MDDEKEGDIRVALVFSVFCLCVTAGGVLLVLYVVVPSTSQPWFPTVATVLIASPWVFWLLTYIYTCIKGCCRRGATDNAHQIHKRPINRNASSAMQSGRQRDDERDPSVASSKEPEMPLTSSM